MKLLSKTKSKLLKGLSPAWSACLRLRGVHCGRQLSCIGRPGLNRKKGSYIRIGDEVVLCSSGMANPVAEGGRCRLATLTPEARLIIHDRVGMSSTVICCASCVEIGQGTQIGGGAMIMDTDFHPRASDGSWATDPAAVSKPISIGENCFIGARAIILKGVNIGNGAVVGAGSVVTKNVPAMTTVAGNPAQVVAKHT